MKKLFSLVCTCLLAMSMQAAETDKYDALYENLPFQMEKVTRPQFPDNEVNLKDFGAVGDGSTLCTEAFSKAIEALSQKGGGKLIVPQGVWFTGPITLKSNINLHIEKGGIILSHPMMPSILSSRLLSRVSTHVVASLLSRATDLPTWLLLVREPSTVMASTGAL